MFYYRHREFITDSNFTIRSFFEYGRVLWVDLSSDPHKNQKGKSSSITWPKASSLTLFSKIAPFERKQKGGFVKGRFWRMCPRSCFWYRRTSECTLVFRVWCRGTSECTVVPFYGTGEHPPKPPFWKPPFLRGRKST